MHANRTTKDEETLGDPTDTRDPDKVSMGDAHRPGYAMNRVPCATLIESVLRFMERYN